MNLGQFLFIHRFEYITPPLAAYLPLLRSGPTCAPFHRGGRSTGRTTSPLGSRGPCGPESSRGYPARTSGVLQTGSGISSLPTIWTGVMGHVVVRAVPVALTLGAKG